MVLGYLFPRVHSTKAIIFDASLALLQMANPRPTKRQRPDPGTSYHDAVPLLNDDFDTVHSREGRLKRVGGGIHTAALPRDPHHGTSWNSVYSWDPPDDLEFALDPDGDLYDDLVEGNVMEEHPAPDNPSKKKRSRVSVSFVYFFFNELDGLIICYTETASCCMDGTPSTNLP